MPDVRRIYTEKKPGYDTESGLLARELMEFADVSGISGLRVLYRYDLEGFSDAEYENVMKRVFPETPADISFGGEIPPVGYDFVFAAKLKPGQYDQRADGATRCAGVVIGRDAGILVETAKVYLLKGSFSEEEKDRIVRYCVNPVDSELVPMGVPAGLALNDSPAADITTLRIDGKDASGWERAAREAGISMSAEDLIFCRGYFSEKEKRDPTLTEMKVLDIYWSDHCRHSTFLTAIDDIEIEGENEPVRKAYDLYLKERAEYYDGERKDVTLMDVATLAMKIMKRRGTLNDLDDSGEINACSVVTDVDVNGEPAKYLLMFKNETHNHPTEIEPFGGAATCIGGGIRDPLSGRAKVFHAIRLTGSGDPCAPISQTLPGKLPQRIITREAAKGFSSYSNRVGLASGQAAEIYDEGYLAKRMEGGLMIGAVPLSEVRREKPEPGDRVILVGGRTGRDGCGGATGSSREHTEESSSVCQAEVQKGDPILESKILRLFGKPEVKKLIKRCNDFGAGGVAVAVGELADGLHVDLDSVLVKYGGLDGTEIAISESQERMAVVTEAGNVGKFIEEAALCDLEATVIATVTDDRRMRMVWRGETIVDISRDFLDTNGVLQRASAFIPAEQRRGVPEEEGGPERLPKILSDINVASQRGLWDMFDSTAGGGPVFIPAGGRRQLTPAIAIASKIPVAGETESVSIASFGYDPAEAVRNPFTGAVHAVVEAVTKAVAAGCRLDAVKLTCQEYFGKMTDDPNKWGKPLGGLLGLFYAQMMLGVPSVGGKDSMSGTFGEIHVPPAVIAFAVGTGKAKNVISPEFKGPGNAIVRLKVNLDEYRMPDFDMLKSNFEAVTKGIMAGVIISANTIGKGGTAAAVAKMAFGNGIGAVIRTDDPYKTMPGAFILEVKASCELPAAFKGLEYEAIGKTTSSETLTVNGREFGLDFLIGKWSETLERIFPSGMRAGTGESAAIARKDYTRISIKPSPCKPAVIVPVFSGTTGEDEVLRAFDKAGASAEKLLIRSHTRGWYAESVRAFADAIERSQIIAFPGGYSAGGEPDGCGKFIAAVLREPSVCEAVNDLLANRCGLILGIADGFHALLRSGLITRGEVTCESADYPVLTGNPIGRHASRLVNAMTVSDKSPWLWKMRAGETMRLPVSHHEGRFAASDAVMGDLIANGQIAAQYVDQAGTASMEYEHNPFGSRYSVEAASSPDGRVLGRMCHIERAAGRTPYINGYAEGRDAQAVFDSGVGFFI